MDRFIAPEQLFTPCEDEEKDGEILVLGSEDYDVTDERIVFLEFTLRKMKAELEYNKVLYFADTDLHEELEEEILYYEDLVKKWVQELQLSN